MSIYDLTTTDSYGESGKFLIYNSDGYVHTFFYKYNTMVKTILSYITKLQKLDANFKDWFIDEIELMYVTSMYRPASKGSIHAVSEHSAADIVLYPFYLNLYLYILIRKYFPKQNIFISSYNHHLHFDNRHDMSGIEILKDKKTRKVILPQNENYYYIYNPSKYYIEIYRGKKAETYKNWMFEYYDLKKSPFFSSIDEFIKKEFFKITGEEQKQRNFTAVIYSIGGIIIVTSLFGGRKNGKDKKDNNRN